MRIKSCLYFLGISCFPMSFLALLNIFYSLHFDKFSNINKADFLAWIKFKTRSDDKSFTILSDINTEAINHFQTLVQISDYLQDLECIKSLKTVLTHYNKKWLSIENKWDLLINWVQSKIPTDSNPDLKCQFISGFSFSIRGGLGAVRI